jgi:Xaa-Pro aminopeptidase
MDYAGRRAELRRQMSERGVDLLAVTPGAAMFYLLGFYPRPDERPCYLFLTEDHEGMVVPELNATETAAHVQVPLAVYKDEEGPVAAIKSTAHTMGFSSARTILVDETMRAAFALLLEEQISTARLGIATELIGTMRMRKDAEEVAALRSNAAMADRAMEAAFGALAVGVAEQDVARVVESAFREAGADRMGFAIVGSGPNSAFPHHTSGSRALRAGEPVVIDIGGAALAYNSDLTRMACVGTPTAEYTQVHGIVEAAVVAALSVAKPGTPAHKVDDAARGVIARAGYGQYFTHRTGHGLGLDIHEPPYITATNTLVLDQGMCFSIEPGIYLPGKFGVRLEEIVVVTASGVEILSRLPRAVFQVPAA